MRTLITILFLFFCLQSLTKADDISDFKIEGISIGESLLKHFSEKEIKQNIKWHYNDNKKNNKFVIVEFYDFKEAEVYHGIQVAVKPEDKNYITYVIAGAIPFENNIEDCYLKMREIDVELSNLFENAERFESSKKVNKSDKSGKSTFSGIYYSFDDGNDNVSIDANASVQCYDFSEEYGAVDNLRVGIRSSEYRDWYFSSLK